MLKYNFKGYNYDSCKYNMDTCYKILFNYLLTRVLETVQKAFEKLGYFLKVSHIQWGKKRLISVVALFTEPKLFVYILASPKFALKSCKLSMTR